MPLGVNLSTPGHGLYAPGAQVSVPERVMQKRFPAVGESRIHNALRVSGLGARTTNSAKHYRRICLRTGRGFGGDCKKDTINADRADQSDDRIEC